MGKLTIRDWLYILAIVFSAAMQAGVYATRLDALEKQLGRLQTEYVRNEIFNLTVEKLELEIANVRAAQAYSVR